MCVCVVCCEGVFGFNVSGCVFDVCLFLMCCVSQWCVCCVCECACVSVSGVGAFV